MIDPEIVLAFAPPEERAAATADPAPLDRLLLRDHIAEVEIGAFQPERGHRQRLRFNVVVEVRPSETPLSDDVDRVLSYDMIVDAIDEALSKERLNLLETLAERVAALVLAPPQSVRAFVRVEKLDLGPHALGVEIVRRRPSEVPVDGLPAPAPLVAYLPDAAVHSARLAGLIDDLEGRGAPVIFCVGPPREPPPKADISAAQRRIDLLALEQNAWVLAGRDPRCVVVETRTELDWAARHGRTSVWAPSKLVFDTPVRPAGDARALALWLARELGARGFACVGEDPPDTGPLAAFRVDPPD